MKKRVGKVNFVVTGVPESDGTQYTINAKAKGDWSLGSLIALKEYIDDMLNSIKKKVKDENRRK